MILLKIICNITNNNNNLIIGDITMKRDRKKIDENGKINSYITVLQSYLMGEEIECRGKGNDLPWHDVSEPSFNFDDFEYRAKPKQTHRPYMNGNEAFIEMQERLQFGWLYNTKTMSYENITSIDDNGICIYDEGYSYEEAFNTFIYPDNSKFGVKLDNNNNEKI